LCAKQEYAGVIDKRDRDMPQKLKSDSLRGKGESDFNLFTPYISYQ